MVCLLVFWKKKKEKVLPSAFPHTSQETLMTVSFEMKTGFSFSRPSEELVTFQAQVFKLGWDAMTLP